MILVWGPVDDPPIEHVCAALEARSADFAHLDDADLATLDYGVMLAAEPSGWVRLAGVELPIDRIGGIYLRPANVEPGPATAASSTLLALAANLPAVVVNRPAAGSSNHSKPFQLNLIARAGLAVPETIVTTDPSAAREFLAEHRRLVYKSVSGVRSIVATLDESEDDRLDRVRTGPVQLQRWIDGRDVRVHVVGDRWFATAIESEVDDYRYAASEGAPLTMAPWEIPPELGAQLVSLTRSMGLLVSGIDLRLAGDGNWYCFEVNPSPGFTFYEDATGQPIADAIAGLLAGASAV